MSPGYAPSVTGTISSTTSTSSSIKFAKRVSSGRGGSGNILRVSELTLDVVDEVEILQKRQKNLKLEPRVPIKYTGRGGSGNIRSASAAQLIPFDISADPDDAYEQIVKEDATKAKRYQIWSTGRGGSGNLSNPLSPSKSDKARRRRSASLFQVRSHEARSLDGGVASLPSTPSVPAIPVSPRATSAEEVLKGYLRRGPPLDTSASTIRTTTSSTSTANTSSMPPTPTTTPSIKRTTPANPNPNINSNINLNINPNININPNPNPNPSIRTTYNTSIHSGGGEAAPRVLQRPKSARGERERERTGGAPWWRFGRRRPKEVEVRVLEVGPLPLPPPPPPAGAGEDASSPVLREARDRAAWEDEERVRVYSRDEDEERVRVYSREKEGEQGEQGEEEGEEIGEEWAREARFSTERKGVDEVPKAQVLSKPRSKIASFLDF